MIPLQEYLRQLLADHKLGEVLRLLDQAARGSYYENTSLLLLSQYNGLKKEITDGIVPEEQRTLRSNRLIQAAQSLLQDLRREVPQVMQALVEARPVLPDAVLETQHKSAAPSQTTIIIHGGNIGGIITGNEGHIEQHIDLRSVQQQAAPLRELIQAETDTGYITREEYEELLDILQEISEQPQPSDKQKGRWKRWLGKAAEAGRKFIGARMDKAADTAVEESAKRWISSGGLEWLETFVKGL